MHVAKIPNRGSRPTYLLRTSYREGGKVKTRTLGNISDLPDEQIGLISAVLKGEKLVPSTDTRGLKITDSKPCGHIAAVLGTMDAVGFERLLQYEDCRERRLIAALAAGRLLRPQSKAATLDALRGGTLAELRRRLDLDKVRRREIYEALDWLLQRQNRIEKKLAKKHLHEETLLFYDLTSTYMEGEKCPLAAFGYSRDHRSDKKQINIGLLCNREGVPISVQVFPGNTADPATVAAQVRKIKQRFKVGRVAVVADRGMLTSARLREDIAPAGLDHITALRAPQLKELAEDESLQPELFDETELCEIESDRYPGERLVACRNPFLTEERRRKRDELLQAAEKKLQAIQDAVERKKRPLRGREKIAERVGRFKEKSKVSKHFRIEYSDDTFRFERNEPTIRREAALDGIYVIRTSLQTTELSPEQTVGAYKNLRVVESAFRCLKRTTMQIRPVYHHLEDRVKAHVFLCMLAYYVEHHMRRALRPLLFAEDDPESAAADRANPVAPARKSAAAKSKAAIRKNADGDPLHTFPGLLDNLATLCVNTVKIGPHAAFRCATDATPLQQKAFNYLGVPTPT